MATWDFDRGCGPPALSETAREAHWKRLYTCLVDTQNTNVAGKYKKISIFLVILCT